MASIPCKEMSPEMKRIVLEAINKLKDQGKIEVFQGDNGNVCVRKIVKEKE